MKIKCGKICEEDFLVDGRPTNRKQLFQSLENTLGGKTKQKRVILDIIEKVKSLEESEK